MIFRLSQNDMHLRLCNRSQYPTHVRMLSISEFATIAQTRAEELEQSAKVEEKTPSTVGHELCESPQSLARHLRITATSALKEAVNAKFQLPSESILLPARDDLAEFEPSTPQNFNDDPK